MSQPLLGALVTQQGNSCLVLPYLVLPTYSLLTPYSLLTASSSFPSKHGRVPYWIHSASNQFLTRTSTLRQPATSSALVQAKPCFCARPFNALPCLATSARLCRLPREEVSIVSYEVLRCAGFQCLAVLCLLAGLLAGCLALFLPA